MTSSEKLFIPVSGTLISALPSGSATVNLCLMVVQSGTTFVPVRVEDLK